MRFTLHASSRLATCCMPLFVVCSQSSEDSSQAGAHQANSRKTVWKLWRSAFVASLQAVGMSIVFALQVARASSARILGPRAMASRRATVRGKRSPMEAAAGESRAAVRVGGLIRSVPRRGRRQITIVWKYLHKACPIVSQSQAGSRYFGLFFFQAASRTAC